MIEFFQGLYDIVCQIGNFFVVIGKIIEAIFNVFVAAFTYVGQMFAALYSFNPIITVPLTVISALLIINLVLSIIKKVPVM